MPDQPKDDRGKPCSIAGLSPRQIGWRALGLPSVTPDPVTSQEQRQTTGPEIAIALVGGVIGWVIWSVGIAPLIGSTLWIFGDVLAQATFAVVVSMVFWYSFLGWIRRARFDRIADIYLGADRCASCGYTLAGLTPDPDSRVVCPECSAAWDRTRLGDQSET